MTDMAEHLAKNRIVYDVVDIWGGGDLPKALEDAARYIRGLDKTSTVEHVFAVEDNSQGWFVTICVRHVLRNTANA